MSIPRLGINIDHVATLRNARGELHPCPIRAAQLACKAGADGITAHLREDRRHIRDGDIRAIKDAVSLPLNMEMAATDEMQLIALEVMPNAVCLVPEKRQEVTTEGGLDVVGAREKLQRYIKPLQARGIRISLFVDPDVDQLEAACEVGADIVELHTGRYCLLQGEAQQEELQLIAKTAFHAKALGLEPHAGHGLSFDNVAAIAAIEPIVELNIGHFMIGEAVFWGLEVVVAKMRELIKESRVSL